MHQLLNVILPIKSKKLHAIDQTIEQNNPKLDITMFIKHNAVDWKEPQDFYFIPVVLA